MNTLSPRLAVPLLLAVILLAASFSRNVTWVTEQGLWTDASAKAPGKARVHWNFAKSLWYRGKLDEAVRELDRAMAADRTYLETYWSFFLMAEAFERAGYYLRALYCYEQVCGNAPPLFRQQVGIACERANRMRRK